MTERLGARAALRQASYVITGGGGRHLDRKRRYHALRREAERRFLDRVEHGEAGLVTTGHCPVCGVQPATVSFTNRVGFSFRTCPAHHIVVMDPVPTDDALRDLYNTGAEQFHWSGGGNDELVIAHEDDLIALRTFLGPGDEGGRLLEVGCATGGFLRGAERTFTAEGVELNADAAARARAAGLTVHDGRIEDLRPTEPYDVVVAIQLVEHLPDPGVLLDEAKRVLRPDGALYLATPAIDSASFAYLGADHTHVASFGHVVLFSKEGLERLAAEHGFTVEHHEYYGGLDVALHDLVTHRFGPDRYVHRLARYNPRLYYACETLDRVTGGRLVARFGPHGAESYQRALLRAPG
jgi:2-polyprenyl-3-methyl-5-hydroxy-6-metoxy-1,4-benzoquinol methylase